MDIKEIKEKNGEVKVSVDFTENELELIKEKEGWDKITDEKLEEWFLNFISNLEN